MVCFNSLKRRWKERLKGFRLSLIIYRNDANYIILSFKIIWKTFAAKNDFKGLQERHVPDVVGPLLFEKLSPDNEEIFVFFVGCH